MQCSRLVLGFKSSATLVLCQVASEEVLILIQVPGGGGRLEPLHEAAYTVIIERDALTWAAVPSCFPSFCCSLFMERKAPTSLVKFITETAFYEHGAEVRLCR